MPKLRTLHGMLAANIPTVAWIAAGIGALWVVGRFSDRSSMNSTTRARLAERVGGFAAVAGCEEAVAELREVAEFISDPERFERMGARTPRGALLVGPPGTGKTMLARALAEETGVEFIHANGSDFVEMYVGVGASRIRDLYKRAREAKRAIVFIDEIDALARARASEKSDVMSGSQTEHENTLIALLTELDGFAQHKGVITIAATNRPDVLDPAVCRPGRLERRIHVPAPDRTGRTEVLKVHTRNKPLAPDVDLSHIADLTAGLSGADLERIANEAAIQAASSRASCIDMGTLVRAVEYVSMGRPSLSRTVTPRDRRITAWHEAGHTVAALVLEHSRKPLAVSITPRGAAGGVTWFESSDHQYLTVEEAKDHLTVQLAGRAAEELLLGGSFTQGASSDLAQATELARQMVGRFGMVAGYLQTRHNIDDATTSATGILVEEARDRALAVLRNEHLLLECVASALLERESLSSEEIKTLHTSGCLPPVTKPAPATPDVTVSSIDHKERKSGAATVTSGVKKPLRRLWHRSSKGATA